MIWLATSALAATPTIELAWSPRGGRLTATAPAGEELAADFPVHLSLHADTVQHSVRTSGTALAGGLVVSDVSGATVEGTIRLGLCVKQTGVCTSREYALHGEVPDRKRGRLDLDVADPHTGATPFGPEATASEATEAFERAAQRGSLVLLDFSAVWCPPCMVLAAEVLHADPVPDALDGYEVAIVDVDHESSFELKDRYDVGGYPTVIAVDAEGNELARIVGYPGRVAFEDWLEEARTGNEARDLSADPATVSPERAATLAWGLVRAGNPKAAAPWLERAAGTDSIDALVARAWTTPSAAAIRSIAARAPDRTADWMPLLLQLDESEADEARTLAATAVHRLRGVDLADALYVAASLEPDPNDAAVLYGAGAAALASTMTGHPRDKASVTFLAELHHLSGHTGDGLRLLEQWSARFPAEPTFELAAANLHLEVNNPEAALTAANRALDRAWGDNRLRAADAKARALVALGRTADAADVAKRALDAFVPDTELDVRTHRYRTRLERFLVDE